MRPSLSPLLYGAALVLGVLLAVGFLILPLYVYFFIDPGAAASVAQPAAP